MNPKSSKSKKQTGKTKDSATTDKLKAKSVKKSKVPEKVLKAWKELAVKEHKLIKEELRHLKNCQLSFFTFSLTATGVLIGIGFGVLEGTATGFSMLPFLAPLVILIPAWWIFIDKAITISRAVGYYRIIEKVILKPSNVVRFMGWENALNWERSLKWRWNLSPLNKNLFTRKEKFVQTSKFFLLVTHHRYWSIVFYSFSMASCGCLLISWKLLKTCNDILGWVGPVLLIFFSFIVALTLFWNVYKIMRLIASIYSYKSNFDFWNWLLIDATDTGIKTMRKIKERPHIIIRIFKKLFGVGE